MAQRRVFVEIDRATLVELYSDRGLTLRAVAEELGISVRTIRRRMAEYAIPIRDRGTRPAHGDQHERPPDTLTRKFLVDGHQRRRMTTPQIAAQTGFSVDTVRWYLCRFGIPIPQVRFTAQHNIDRQRLVKFRRQGLTVEQVAERFGCSNTTVEPALRQYGLARRSPR